MPLLLPSFLVFLCCRRLLPLFHPFGIFLLEKNLKRQKQQFHVQKETVIFIHAPMGKCAD